MKRIFLFLMTNLLVMVLVGMIISLFGLDRYGHSLSGILLYCLIWGSVGSSISLQLSKFAAKRAMGLQPLSSGGRYGFCVEMVEEYARAAKIKTPEPWENKG